MGGAACLYTALTWDKLSLPSICAASRDEFVVMDVVWRSLDRVSKLRKPIHI